jgi:hypothetical protein
VIYGSTSWLITIEDGSARVYIACCDCGRLRWSSTAPQLSKTCSSLSSVCALSIRSLTYPAAVLHDQTSQQFVHVVLFFHRRCSAVRSGQSHNSFPHNNTLVYTNSSNCRITSDARLIIKSYHPPFSSLRSVRQVYLALNNSSFTRTNCASKSSASLTPASSPSSAARAAFIIRAVCCAEKSSSRDETIRNLLAGSSSANAPQRNFF